MKIKTSMTQDDGEQIRLLRQERGITQARVAHELGLTQAAVSQIENGTPQSLPALIKVCDFFGVEVEVDR